MGARSGWEPIDDAMIVARLNLLAPNGCVEWTGKLSGYGYGVIGRWDPERGESRNYQAHRYIWERYIGKIPDGMTVHHKCYNRKCVNIWHLEIVTRGDNTREATSRRPKVPPKLFCKYGHPKKQNKDGSRSCLTCGREAMRRSRIRKGLPVDVGMGGTQKAQTHCKHGHEFTPENTSYKTGWRTCKKCAAQRQLAAYHAKKKES